MLENLYLAGIRVRKHRFLEGGIEPLFLEKIITSVQSLESSELLELSDLEFIGKDFIGSAS